MMTAIGYIGVMSLKVGDKVIHESGSGEKHLKVEAEFNSLLTAMCKIKVTRIVSQGANVQCRVGDEILVRDLSLFWP